MNQTLSNDNLLFLFTFCFSFIFHLVRITFHPSVGLRRMLVGARHVCLIRGCFFFFFIIIIFFMCLWLLPIYVRFLRFFFFSFWLFLVGDDRSMAMPPSTKRTSSSMCAINRKSIILQSICITCHQLMYSIRWFETVIASQMNSHFRITEKKKKERSEHKLKFDRCRFNADVIFAIDAIHSVSVKMCIWCDSTIVRRRPKWNKCKINYTRLFRLIEIHLRKSKYVSVSQSASQAYWPIKN